MDGRILFLVLLAAIRVANADKVNAEWYSSARALGMGNAAISCAEDPASAMFYNPAALARNKKFNFELFTPHIEMGLGNFKLNSESAKISEQTKLDKADPALQKNPETATYFGASLYPNFYAQNFAFGVLIRHETSAYRRRVTNELLYRARFMVIPTMGFSMSMFNGMWKFGVAARVIQLTENDKITSNYTDQGFFSAASEGAGLGLDGGWLWTFPLDFKPTIGVVVRNIGDTSFPGGTSMGIGESPISSHDSEKQKYDLGFSIAPKIGKRSIYTIALDYRDVGNESNTLAGRKINFGMEAEFNHWFYLRGGARAGYWTAGLGFGGKNGTLDLGTYADELDPQKFREVEDRRVFLRYGGRF